MKKIIILAVLLLCLTGCGSNNNELVQSYNKLNESYLNKSGFENEMNKLGYCSDMEDEPGPSIFEGLPEWSYSYDYSIMPGEEKALNISDYANQLIAAYKKKELPFVDYNSDNDGDSENDGDSDNEIKNSIDSFDIIQEKQTRNGVLALCKKLKETGFNNIYESVLQNKKEELILIQNGVKVTVGGKSDCMNISIVNNDLRGDALKAWEAYIYSNVKDGFWASGGAVGGLMDRLTLQGGKNEIGCKYEKKIQVYQKDKKAVQVNFYFQKNRISGESTFLPKEKQSTINILKTVGVSEQDAKKFVDTYDPDKCKDITLDGKTYSTETKEGNYVLAIR